MKIRELLKEISENYELDDEVFVADSSGLYVRVDYIEKQAVYKILGRTKEAMTLNIKNRIDFRTVEPEESDK